jgi:hypothetical protein
MFERPFVDPRPRAPVPAYFDRIGEPQRRLTTLRGFAFPVAASRRDRAAAIRIARRAQAARDLLQKAVGVAPDLSLRILGRDDWHRYAEVAAYGVTHPTHDGHLVVGAEPADEWHRVSEYFAERLPAGALARLVDVHGVDRANGRGPALDALAESLITHEVAHALAARLRFPRRWLEEAFANYVLVATLGETDPAGLRRVGSLANAAVTLDEGMPTLADFEARFGRMEIVPSVLAELAITRGVYGAYATRHLEPLARMFNAFRIGARVRDADYELGRTLASIHPAIAAIPLRFASAQIGLAA